MKTRIKLGTQLEQSAGAYSVPYTDVNRNLKYTTGADINSSKILYFDADNDELKWLSVGSLLSISNGTLNASAGSGGYATIQEEGVNLTNRNNINFIGSGITATDNSAQNRTDVSINPSLNNIASLTNEQGLFVRNSSGGWVVRTLTGTTNRITVDNGTGVSANPTIDISSTYAGQSSITTLGTITTGTWQGSVINKSYLDSDVAYLSGTQTFSGNKTFTNNVTLNGTPTAGTHAVNKAYVDGLIQGLNFKDSVRVATTANFSATFTTTNAGQFTGAPSSIDGVSLSTGNRVLVKNQSTQAHNGIYEVLDPVTTWKRAEDANLSTELGSAFVFVEEGSTQADTAWVTTFNSTEVLNTAAMPWVQFTSVSDIIAGAGLVKGGNTINVVGTAGRIIANADSIDLATTAVTPNSYGSASSVATFTVDGFGRLTAASSTAISIASTAINNFTEAVQDVVGNNSFLIPGTGIDIDYNDPLNTLTIGLKHLGFQNLTDPNNNRILYWNDTTNTLTWLSVGNGLTLNATNNTLSLATIPYEQNAVTSITVTDTEPSGVSWASQNGSFDIKTGEFKLVNPSVQNNNLEIDVAEQGAIKYIRFRHAQLNSTTSYVLGGVNVPDTITLNNGHITNLTSRALSLDNLFTTGEGGETGLVESVLIIENQTVTGGVAIAYSTASSTGITVTKTLGQATGNTRYNTTFHGFPNVADKIKVYVNGVLASRTGGSVTRDYAIDTSLGTITFVDTITTSDRVTFVVTDYKTRI